MGYTYTANSGVGLIAELGNEFEVFNIAAKDLFITFSIFDAKKDEYEIDQSQIKGVYLQMETGKVKAVYEAVNCTYLFDRIGEVDYWTDVYEWQFCPDMHDIDIVLSDLYLT